MDRNKIGIILIALLAAISVGAILVRMIPSGEEVGRLGVTGGGSGIPCTGNLEVKYSPMDDKCALQADVEMKNCEGTWYVFKGNNCGGTLICTGGIKVQTDRWRCSWEDTKGTHTFTLCENVDKKDTVTITC